MIVTSEPNAGSSSQKQNEVPDMLQHNELEVWSHKSSRITNKSDVKRESLAQVAASIDLGRDAVVPYPDLGLDAVVPYPDLGLDAVVPYPDLGLDAVVLYPDQVYRVSHDQEWTAAPRRLDVQRSGVDILRKVMHLGLTQMPRVWLIVWFLSSCSILTAVCYMIPHQAAHQTLRLPPRWEPGLENALPFRTWLQDLLLWTITSDLEPHRQAAAIISQLGGAARELARTSTPQEIFNGGVINGQHLDPVSFLIHGLSTRFSPLDDEIRIRAAQDLLQFQRKGNESVDVLITRFETIRSRARAEGGGANVSTESASLILLRAIGVSSEQFQRLTQPFGLRLLNSEAELAQLMHQLRRMGHIIEHHPSNIADSLHRNVGASNSGQAFVVHSAEGSAEPSQTSRSYVGQSLPPQSSDTWEVPGQFSQSSTDWAHHVDPNVASDTDSATESDDFQQREDERDLEGLTAGEADEHLFWQYTEAKRRWRKYTGKPVRALRRVLRRKGKGKGKTKGAFFDITNALHESSYFRAKGKGGKSSGKGWGRNQNPKGRDAWIGWWCSNW